MMHRRNQRFLDSFTGQAGLAGLALALLSACQASGNPDVITWAHAERFSDPTGVVRAGIKAVEYQASDPGGLISGQVAGQAMHYAWNRYTCEHTWYIKNAITGKEATKSQTYDVYDSKDGMERFPHRVTEATSRFWEGGETDPLRPRLGEQVLPIDGIEFKTLPFVYSVGDVPVTFEALGSKGTPDLSVKATFIDLKELGGELPCELVAKCEAGQRFRIPVSEQLIDTLAQLPRSRYRVELQVLGVEESPTRSLFIDPKDL